MCIKSDASLVVGLYQQQRGGSLLQLVRRERQLNLHLLHLALEFEFALKYTLPAEVGAFFCAT